MYRMKKRVLPRRVSFFAKDAPGKNVRNATRVQKTGKGHASGPKRPKERLDSQKRRLRRRGNDMKIVKKENTSPATTLHQPKERFSSLKGKQSKKKKRGFVGRPRRPPRLLQRKERDRNRLGKD